MPICSCCTHTTLAPRPTAPTWSIYAAGNPHRHLYRRRALPMLKCSARSIKLDTCSYYFHCTLASKPNCFKIIDRTRWWMRLERPNCSCCSHSTLTPEPHCPAESIKQVERRGWKISPAIAAPRYAYSQAKMLCRTDKNAGERRSEKPTCSCYSHSMLCYKNIYGISSMRLEKPTSSCWSYTRLPPSRKACRIDKVVDRWGRKSLPCCCCFLLYYACQRAKLIQFD